MSALTREQILNQLTQVIPSNFVKTPFPRQQLTGSASPDSNEYVVYNLSNDVNHGTHWTCSANKSNINYIIYFDSYGMPPPDDVINYLKRSNKKLFYSTGQLQSDNSTACGQYCIYFLTSFYKNVPLYNILYPDSK
jgi:hypothetical protein